MASINEQLNQSQKEYGTGMKTNYFRFEEGDNRIRVLTAGEVIATHFFGKGQKASTCYGQDKGCPFHGDKAPKNEKGQERKASIKYTCYVMDKDEFIQLADLPYSVIKEIGEYQQNVDYAFDAFPMPYDVTVKFDPKSNSPANMYKVIASPKREQVSDVIMGQLAEVMSKLSPVDSVKKKKDWQISEHRKEGIWIDPVLAEEERQKKYKDWKAEKVANLTKEKVETIEYPANDIDPNDINF